MRGCRFYFVFVYFVIKIFNFLPVPASFFPIYEQCYIGAETWEEGGTRCQRALAAEGDNGAEEVGQQEEAETVSGCPRLWCWSNRRTGETEGSLPCSWVEEGWLPSEREQRSRRCLPEPAAIRHVWGGAGNGGLTAGCPRPEEPSPSARRWRSIVPSPKDIQYHRMAPKVRASQLVEDQSGVFPGTGLRFLFFFLSPPSHLCHSSSFRLLFSFLICPYPQVRRGRPNAPPPHGECCLEGTPGLRGAMGLCDE